MGIYEYTFLSKEEQAELLWDRGLFIDSQNGNYFNKALYHLGSFYVELTIDKVTNEITEINAYQTPVELTRLERTALVLN
jgi:hypothetical protein